MTGRLLDEPTTDVYRACIAMLSALHHGISVHVDDVLDGIQPKDAFFGMAVLTLSLLADMPEGGPAMWLSGMALFFETGELPE